MSQDTPIFKRWVAVGSPMQGSRETYSLTSCDIEVVCSQTALIAIYERVRGFKQANGNDIMSKLMSVAVLVVPYYPIVS